MAERKPFLLRLDPETFAALQAWAADDLRSVNGQVEFLLRRSLRDAARLPGPRGEAGAAGKEAASRAAAPSAGTPGADDRAGSGDGARPAGHDRAPDNGRGGSPSGSPAGSGPV
jgi:hypothetical protein